MAKITNDAAITIYTKRIGAMTKHFATATTLIPSSGDLITPGAVLKIFQDTLAVRTAVATAQAAYQSALVRRDSMEAEFRKTDEAMRQWVIHRFGPESTEALEFGYAARKTPTMTAEGRFLSVQLNKATREARHTMGSRQKLEIRGTLDAPPRQGEGAEPTPLHGFEKGRAEG